MTPKQWSSQKYVLKKTFTADDLAVKDGYTAGKWFYTKGDERIPRKSEWFLVNITARMQRQGWIRVQVKIPVVYGEPWKDVLKSEIEKELKSNYDLIGVFLSDIGQELCRGFDLTWEEEHGN